MTKREKQKTRDPRGPPCVLVSSAIDDNLNRSKEEALMGRKHHTISVPKLIRTIPHEPTTVPHPGVPLPTLAEP